MSFGSIAFTPVVKALRERHGSRRQYERMEQASQSAQARLKILGRVDVLEGDAAEAMLARVRMPGHDAVIERVFVVHVEAFDWNCPQHITPRYTAEEIRKVVARLEERAQTLERENAALRRELVDRAARRSAELG